MIRTFICSLASAIRALLFVCLLGVSALQSYNANAQQADLSDSSESTQSLENAHKRLLKAGDLQTDLPHREPKSRPDRLKPNGFWQMVGSVFKFLVPAFKALLWLLVPLIVVVLLFSILRETLGVRLPNFKPKTKTDTVDIGYKPDERAARMLLEDADSLADRGEYEAAARLLLNRSIADIETLRQTKIKRSLTAREIGNLDTIPHNARPAFASIAHIVESAFFAGMPLSKDGFLQARTAYERFALPEVWR